MEDLPVGVEALRRQAFDLSQLTNRVGAVENAIRGRLIPPRGVQGNLVGFDSGGIPVLVDAVGALAHDHARPDWSATSVRTTSFTCPSNANTLVIQLSDLVHANVTGTWDMHVYVGTTPGGSDLFSIGGYIGWVGAGAGTGCWYPANGSYLVPIVAAHRGTTIYVTSSAPAGNYYLRGNIRVYYL